MEIPASVRTGLDAIPTTDAVFFVNQHDAFRTFIGGPNGTNLNTGRFGAMIAHLRNKKALKDFSFWNSLYKVVDTTIGRLYGECAIIFNGVLFDPRPEEERFFGNVIFSLTGPGARSAADTFFDVYADGIPGHSLLRLIGGKQHGLKWFHGRADNQRACQQS